MDEPRAEVLLSVLDLIGAPSPQGALAPLRFWGQTGERSGAWMAAADPVHLETRLHSLRMRSLRADELSQLELRLLFEHLQATLGTESGIAFTRLGHHGYLRCEQAIATAPMSASVLHGLPPDEYVPSGDTAAAYHRLLGELQMTLHEHEVNRRRAAAGQPEINSLWIWGGGIAPEAEARSLPLLIADDALFRGYWHSCRGERADWDSDFEKSRSNFVAVMPDVEPIDAAPALVEVLRRVKRTLMHGMIKTVTLLFRDGLSVEINRWDTVRLWRGELKLLQKATDDD